MRVVFCFSYKLSYFLISSIKAINDGRGHMDTCRKVHVPLFVLSRKEVVYQKLFVCEAVRGSDDEVFQCIVRSIVRSYRSMWVSCRFELLCLWSYCDTLFQVRWHPGIRPAWNTGIVQGRGGKGNYWSILRQERRQWVRERTELFCWMMSLPLWRLEASNLVANRSRFIKRLLICGRQEIGALRGWTIFYTKLSCKSALVCIGCSIFLSCFLVHCIDKVRNGNRPISPTVMLIRRLWGNLDKTVVISA